VRFWKKSTGEQLHSLVHESECLNFDISPNGALIAVAHADGVSIWSLKKYEKVCQVELGFLADVRFQTDNKIVAALADGHVYLIELNKK